MSAPVSSTGTFTVYPLPTSSSSATSYDLVIHGPNMATIIVKSVPVGVGDPTATTPVNIGTVTARTATPSAMNINATTPLPAGALVGFYQTIPASGEVPYLVEAFPLDPFSRTFATDQTVSNASLDYGNYASGSNVSLTTANADEGAAVYRVAGTAPLFTDGVLTTTVKATGSTTATLIAVPALTAAAGANLDTVTVTIAKSTAGKYNKGEVILSKDGAIVATAPLDTLLTASAASGSVAINQVPGGGNGATFASALYYVSVRVWNTSTASSVAATREIYPTALDLTTGVQTAYSLTID